MGKWVEHCDYCGTKKCGKPPTPISEEFHSTLVCTQPSWTFETWTLNEKSSPHRNGRMGTFTDDGAWVIGAHRETTEEVTIAVSIWKDGDNNYTVKISSEHMFCAHYTPRDDELSTPLLFELRNKFMRNHPYLFPGLHFDEMMQIEKEIQKTAGIAKRELGAKKEAFDVFFEAIERLEAEYQ